MADLDCQENPGVLPEIGCKIHDGQSREFKRNPAILAWSLGHIQDDDGSSVYLRLTTRPISQLEREMTSDLRAAIERGRHGR